MQTSDKKKTKNFSENLMKVYEDLTFSDSKDSDVKRENANIDGDSAMGVMLKYGSEGSKFFADQFILKPEHSKAHKSGDIHIHDLDFLTLTATCSQIDLIKLFDQGFSTGHGYIREPNGIRSYAALACIAIQSNQNDQHGGQSIPNFDRAMALGVRKTYANHYRRNLIKALKLLTNLEVKDIVETTSRQIVEEWGFELRMGANSEYSKEEAKLLANDDFDIEIIEKAQAFAREEAKKETNRSTYQAMEALIHNLNTMNSRAGAQVPFSSINYGTDTSKEGRMVTKNILLALEAGLGNGETPIFPIQIFRIKESINLSEDSPNYDLFKLACRVSSKRLFPNFSFQDAPFNAQYYVEGRPETEISYMGCVQGAETITYKINHELYVEGFKRAYDRISKLFGEKVYGKSLYVDTSDKNISIYDTSNNKFVKVKKFIKNPDKGDWVQLKMNNGRTLLATYDHPLPVEGKGRTFVKDIEIGDKVPVTYEQYSESRERMDSDLAWLLGALICDGSFSSNNLSISLGADEDDIAEKVTKVVENIGYCTSVKKQNRGERGTYQDINFKFGTCLKFFKEGLSEMFGGVLKAERQIPNILFRSNKETRFAFLAGMLDADGYASARGERQETCGMTLGSTNKEFALGQMALIQSLGYPCKMYLNKYSKGSNTYRYLLEFSFIKELLPYMASEKKKIVLEKCNGKISILKTEEVSKITEIIPMGHMGECSYDVETETDTFDVSGILSHNCRTRVIGNTYDPANEITHGRGNLSFTSVNLPRLAIDSNGDVDLFFKKLNAMMSLCTDQLLHRFEILCKKKAKNFPFLMGQGVWLDSDKVGSDGDLTEVLKHGTLTVGFIGLAEALTSLTGTHHGESEDAQELGLRIISFMRDKMDKEARMRQLNFSLIATPAEGLSGRFVKIDVEKYGIIQGVTDKEYYTNSFHIPVGYDINAFDKIRIEAPYHALTNAGHITYVEMDGDLSKNLPAFEKVIRKMHESGVGYGSINHPVDRDSVCGYTGVIDDVCPGCGRLEQDGIPFERIRRITGYLVGTVDRFNNAKQAEVKDRIKHSS